MFISLKNFSYRVFLIAVLALFFICSHFINGSSGIALASTSNNILKSIAILPFENLTDKQGASTKVVSQIKQELKGKGWLLIVRDEVIDEYLYKRRIRYTGAITRLKAREMGKVLGVDAVMVGSVEMFGPVEGENTVSVSARLISTIDGAIIWADNIAYTGEDFVGFFGIGLITDLKKLNEVVVSKLVGSIADNFFIKDTVMSPFEIEKFVTYPAIGKVGDKIELRVKFLSIIDDPKEVSVIVDGKQLSLNKISDGVYSIFVDAPVIEGTHIVDVVAVDGESVPFSFDAVGKIVIDSTPPVIKIISDNDIFSTQRKGIKMVLRPLMLSYDAVSEWYAEVINEDGEVVLSDRGFNSLPETLKWVGYTSEGKIAESGNYDVKLVVSDKAGNLGVAHKSVIIKNDAPEVSVDVDVVEDTMFFTINKSDNNKGDEIGSWSFVLSERTGKELKSFYGEGEIPNKLEYVLDNNTEINKMAFILTASDVVGNELRIKKTLPSMFKSKRPFAGLNSSSSGASALSDF